MKFKNQFAVVASISLILGSTVQAQEDAVGTPLEGVTREMKLAANQLSKKTTDKLTQQPQTDAVSKLDSLIAALEKERQNLGNGVNARPSRPANSSDIRTGPGGMGDLHGAREQGNRWGELPAHERDRILQSLTEGFPAHYQTILEAYYKRLAVEKRAENVDPASTEPKGDKKNGTATMAPKAEPKPAIPAGKVTP